MARVARLVVKGEAAVYHVICRSALDGFPLGDLEKEQFVKMLRDLSRVYFVELLGFSVMGNHAHVLARMHTGAYIDLNAVRAGIVKRPEDYRWCSLGYHLQSGNAGGLLSLDFGLRPFSNRGRQRGRS